MCCRGQWGGTRPPRGPPWFSFCLRVKKLGGAAHADLPCDLIYLASIKANAMVLTCESLAVNKI